MQTIHVVGGGTVVHVRNHLALAAPAYGTTARQLAAICTRLGHPPRLTLTRMADPASHYETNDDLQRLAAEIVAEPATRIVFWNPAVCDFTGQIGTVAPGRKAERLHTAKGAQAMTLVPSAKIVSSIRAERKDLFLVAFKTTTGASEDEMYVAGLRMMKGAHINLVLVNDVVTRLNLIVTPEEARYHVTQDRGVVLERLVEMTLLRAASTFTRSTVIAGEGVAWTTVASNLREVVDHCIRRGAYRAVTTETHGPVTAGHFASRRGDGRIVTSRRWSDFNQLARIGMVEITPAGTNEVLARGGKPSVGGQSQRIIFTAHPELDHIVHFHCPLKPGSEVPVRSQRAFECGSHQCGQNTSDGLRELEDGIWAVMLDQHGPNVVYRRDVPAPRVIAFIERNFDLDAKTGGERRVMAFVKAGELVVPIAQIEAVELTELEHGRVRVTHTGGQIAWASGADAYDLVLRVHPSALEGRRLRWVRHAWAVHNLIAHPMMQVLAWLGLPRLGLALHDRTVPRPRRSQRADQNAASSVTSPSTPT